MTSMWQKIRSLPHVAYLACTQFIQNFKKDERGLSGIVVTILLILVAVLAIVLTWQWLGVWLQELWDNITGQAAKIT